MIGSITFVKMYQMKKNILSRYIFQYISSMFFWLLMSHINCRVHWNHKATYPVFLIISEKFYTYIKMRIGFFVWIFLYYDKGLYRIFPKQKKEKIIRLIIEENKFLMCGYLVDICSKNVTIYPFESEIEKRSLNTYFLKVLMPSLQSERKGGTREKYMKRGRVQEIRKGTKEKKDTRLHWRVLEASGRVAFDVHRMMSALLEEEERRKKKRRETFYGHGGSCLFAVGQRRRGDRGIEENHQFVDRN